MKQYIGMNNNTKREAEQSIRILKAISYSEMENLLLDAGSREYDATAAVVQVEPLICRVDVTINAKHSRVPLSKILNFVNCEKGFDLVYPFWERGEIARKDGRIEETISLLDKARYNEYNTPVLYESYAKAYHQIKVYDNEIVILEEGIDRESSSKDGVLKGRRDKAIKLLFAQQEAERKDLKKAKAKEQKAAQKAIEVKVAVSGNKQQSGRSIIQMTDDGTVIKEFETIASV